MLQDAHEIAYKECQQLQRLCPDHELARYFGNLDDEGISSEFYERFSTTKKAPHGEMEVNHFYAEYYKALREARKEIVVKAIDQKLLEVRDGQTLRYKGVPKYIFWDSVSFYATIILENKHEFIFAPESLNWNMLEGHSFQPQGKAKLVRTITIT